MLLGARGFGLRNPRPPTHAKTEPPNNNTPALVTFQTKMGLTSSRLIRKAELLTLRSLHIQTPGSECAQATTSVIRFSGHLA